MNKSSAIYIAGHKGLVGSVILKRLRKEGFNNLIYRTHQELDLENQSAVESFFKENRPEYIILAAAKVGGIWANATYPVDFIYRNLAIQNNILRESWRTGVKRLLFLGSSCIYPRDCPQPIKEEYLLTGSLEITNRPYAVAKIAGIIECEAYNRQYGTKFLALMPTNLYGPEDNFDLQSSHVMPALIRKFHLAKLAAECNEGGIMEDEKRFGPIPIELKSTLSSILHKDIPPQVTLWGTGNPRREFLHVDDLAKACQFILGCDEEILMEASILPKSKSFQSLPLINIGCGEDQIIADLADLIKKEVRFEGDVKWDCSKPDGTPQKLLDVAQIHRLGWRATMPLGQGIKQVCQWYQSEIGAL
jgi:GDP-L-fucose synthase